MVKVEQDTIMYGACLQLKMTHQLFCYNCNHIYHRINQQGLDLFVLRSLQIDMDYKNRTEFILAVQRNKKSGEKGMRYVIKKRSQERINSSCNVFTYYYPILRSKNDYICLFPFASAVTDGN